MDSKSSEEAVAASEPICRCSFTCKWSGSLRFTAGAAALVLAAGSSLGLDRSTGPQGARIDIVKNARMFGLDGTGVRIGQTEDAEPRHTHAMLNGRVTRHNQAGPSDHATGVASIMIGAAWDPPGPTPEIRGVAHNANLWSTAAPYFADFNWLNSHNVHIINASFGIGSNGNGNGVHTLFVDQMVRANNVLFVKSAGNDGAMGNQTITIPGDAYNGITVGALGADSGGANSTDYWRVANYSSRGPTRDGRHKPDIVAPGSLINMAGGDANDDEYVASGTSFAAPHVAGTAALLRQRAAAYDPPGGNYDWRFDRRVLKATILNAASKHVVDPQNGNRPWVKTPAATNAFIPLDDAMGVGALNGMATIRQYNPTHRQLGVRSNEIDANGSDAWAVGGFQTRGSLVTATLTWERDVTLDDPAHPELPGSYTARDLADLDLKLVRSDGFSTVVAESISFNDNVEHIYFNVPADDFYTLQVFNHSGDAPRYGLAFSAGSSIGHAFSVRDGMDYSGHDHRVEGLLAPFNDHEYPNDVNALGVAGPGNFRVGGEVFVGGAASDFIANGTNQQRLSGALGTRSRVGPHNAPPAAMSVLAPGSDSGVFGLTSGDEITGLSWGTDGSRLTDGGRKDSSIIFFSVDPDAVGLPNTAVLAESSLNPQMGGNIPDKFFPRNPGGGDPGNEAAGDIFKTQELPRFGWYASIEDNPAIQLNDLEIDESAFGLQAPAIRGSLLEDGREDDLDAFEFDDPVLHPRGVDQDGDGMHNKPAFFTLSEHSPSIIPGIFDASDIFVSMPADPSDGFDMEPDAGGFSFQEYADYSLLGLTALDAIDALIVSDIGPGGMPDGIANAGDEVLFSLSPFSVSGGPGDIFYSALNGEFGVFAAAGAIGLDANDNLNALDIRRFIPAPATISLLAPAALLMRRRRSTCLS